MRIVVDTNVVASAVLFGGKPGALIRFILTHTVSAVATQEILDEYQSTIDSLFQKYNVRELFFSLDSIYSAMEIIPAQTRVDVCRDPDDNKFISCAIDGQCYYRAPLFIVSGGFSHLSKVRLERFSVVTFSGSHAQIFLHRLFCSSAENPSARINRDTLYSLVFGGFSHSGVLRIPASPQKR